MNYRIIGKYIKKLNFSIPNSKTFFLLSKDIKNYKINIDIKSNQIKNNIIEISTSLNLTPTKENFDKINTEVIFATIVEIIGNNINKEEIEKMVLIDVPNQIYDELRNIFINLFEYSGFKDIKINKSVDFEKLYAMRKVQ